MVVAGTVLLIVAGAAFAWDVARANWMRALTAPAKPTRRARRHEHGGWRCWTCQAITYDPPHEAATSATMGSQYA